MYSDHHVPFVLCVDEDRAKRTLQWACSLQLANKKAEGLRDGGQLLNLILDSPSSLTSPLHAILNPATCRMTTHMLTTGMASVIPAFPLQLTNVFWSVLLLLFTRELILFSRAGLGMTSSSPRLKPQNATEWCFGEDICYPDNAPIMMEAPYVTIYPSVVSHRPIVISSHMCLGENVEDSAKIIDTSLVAQGAYNAGVAVDAMNPAFEPMSMFPESHTLSNIPFTGSMHWVTGMPSDGPYQAPLVAPDMSLLPAQFLAGPSHLE